MKNFTVKFSDDTQFHSRVSPSLYFGEFIETRKDNLIVWHYEVPDHSADQFERDLNDNDCVVSYLIDEVESPAPDWPALMDTPAFRAYCEATVRADEAEMRAEHED